MMVTAHENRLFFQFEFAMLVSGSLNVLRTPCSEVLVWRAEYRELLVVSLFSGKTPFFIQRNMQHWECC